MAGCELVGSYENLQNHFPKSMYDLKLGSYENVQNHFCKSAYRKLGRFLQILQMEQANASPRTPQKFSLKLDTYVMISAVDERATARFEARKF